MISLQILSINIAIDISGAEVIDTVGRNKTAIEKYIRNQIEEDKIAEPISMKEYIDPFTGEPVKGSK